MARPSTAARRYAEAVFEIARRDVTRKGQRNEIEVLGAWGMAATAAIEAVARDLARQQARFLQLGDVVESWIDGIGSIRNRLTAPDEVTC